MPLPIAGPNSQKYYPSCLLAHELVNKLSVVVGYCDLLTNHALEDLELHKRLDAIREITLGMAKQLNDHQCQIDVVTRETVSNKLPKALVTQVLARDRSVS
jgi:hypothetical protein